MTLLVQDSSQSFGFLLFVTFFLGRTLNLKSQGPNKNFGQKGAQGPNKNFGANKCY